MTKPAEKYQIRLAEAADVNQLLDLELRCFTSDRFNKRQFAYLVKKANGLVFVYEIDKKIVGSLILLKRKNSQRLRIYSISVDPDFRGKGIASKLLSQAEKAATDQNLKALTLEVKSTNRAAIDLYVRFGFETKSVKENYYEDGNSAFVMVKEII